MPAFETANPQLADADIVVEYVATSGEVALRLRPGQLVGAVPLFSPVSRKVAGGVIIQPRFGWTGIGSILSATGWHARPRLLKLPMVPGSAKEIPPWVLAGPIVERFRMLLREMRRGFELKEVLLSQPRGQIVWSRYVREQLPSGSLHKLPCRFSDLGDDMVLRSFIRWSLESVIQSLTSASTTDLLCRRVLDGASQLHQTLRDVPARFPTPSAVAMFQLNSPLATPALQEAIEAISWVAEERGLAGSSQPDGLSWSMSMPELFERWVEHLIREWAANFGGIVTTGRDLSTSTPILWRTPGAHSLTSLVPDFVVRAGNHAWVFDAKYKSHFEELDDARWSELADEIRAEHRHDVHQVLAYASLLNCRSITSVLVYPTRSPAGPTREMSKGSIATIPAGGCDLRLALLPTSIGNRSTAATAFASQLRGF